MALGRSKSALLTCGAILLTLERSRAFNLANIFKSPSFSPPSLSGPSIKQLKAEILSSISGTNNGKDASLETQQRVLSIVRKLETTSPVPETILSDPQKAEILNGRWYLQYTSPSDLVTDEDAWVPENASEGNKIETRKSKSKGSVSASGIQVDTSNRVTTQTIDIVASRVDNFVEQDFGSVEVSGSFRVSENVPNRAVVSFDRGSIAFNNGFTLQLGWVFNAVAIVRGTKDSGWLETT